VVIEDFIIPTPVSDETPSQKTRRVPITHIGRDSNSNGSSTTLNKRVRGSNTIEILNDPFPQRGWLSRTYDQQKYLFSTYGRGTPYFYMIDTGLQADHEVVIRFVGLFK
jgi:hypothetical protein